MVSNEHSISESETEITSQRSFGGQERFKKNAKLKRRKSTVSNKTIKDRLFCVTFCYFNHVRNTRSGKK